LVYLAILTALKIDSSLIKRAYVVYCLQTTVQLQGIVFTSFLSNYVSTEAGSWQKRERGTHQIAYRSKDTRKSQPRHLFCIDLIKRRIHQRSAYDHKLNHTLIILSAPPVIKCVPIMSNVEQNMPDSTSSEPDCGLSSIF
jgi:hypothetical protein